ncbi:zinc-binding dehydrogenase [Streptomyces bicolor]|uniref:zinc-binding dehydrogenase n=1 Tax=Streptomyces bicolor TaxID=66874 RepID=UPI000996EF81
MTERYPSSALSTGNPDQQRGAVKPAVHGEFALEEAAEAHAAVEARGNRGKVVLHP